MHRPLRAVDHDHAEHEGDDRGPEEAGMRGKVKVIIGGAPVTQKYADEIGAPSATAAWRGDWLGDEADRRTAYRKLPSSPTERGAACSLLPGLRRTTGRLLEPHSSRRVEAVRGLTWRPAAASC